MFAGKASINTLFTHWLSVPHFKFLENVLIDLERKASKEIEFRRFKGIKKCFKNKFLIAKLHICENLLKVVSGVNFQPLNVFLQWCNSGDKILFEVASWMKLDVRTSIS